ncbi:terminase [Corynebacterium diphtheriae]|nr:terminase [Corynebacterium diphtheriae]
MTGSSASDLALPPGYYRGELGEWKTLPWPEDMAAKVELLENSLGPSLIDWAEWRTDEPGLLNDDGEPWQFTDGQARFLILWYAFDEQGRFIYRRGIKRGAKGTGKDPFGAAMCNIELLGPSQLWWDGEKWAGKRHELPLVQIASNSEAQSKAVLRVANSQLGSEAVAYYQLDKGQTATYVKGGAARMEVLTASERSSEGNPATFILLNETHHMTKESGGQNLAAVARRNVGKSKRSLQARIVECTNAHAQGSASVGEKSFESWQKQQSGRYKALKKDILYDSIEYDPRLDFYDAQQRELALRQAYADAPWADIERLGAEIIDPELSAAEAIRFYLNGVAEQEDAYVAAQNFAALADPSKLFDEDDQIVMFLDCSKSEDATALMGCRVSDGFNQTLGVWSRPRGKRGEGYLVDRAEVDAVVRECFDSYRVVAFGVDPSPAKEDSTEASYWRPMIDGWHRDFRKRLRVWATPGARGNSVLWDMRLSAPGGADRNRKFSQEVEIVRALIDDEGLDGVFRHDGDPALVAHVNNTRVRWNKFGLTVGKKTRDSTQSVDLCVAMIAANVLRREALNSGKVRVSSGRRRSGRRKVVMA